MSLCTTSAKRRRGVGSRATLYPNERRDARLPPACHSPVGPGCAPGASSTCSRRSHWGDELAFLQQVTNDAALHEQLASIMSVASDGIHHAAKSAVAFDWP